MVSQAVAAPAQHQLLQIIIILVWFISPWGCSNTTEWLHCRHWGLRSVWTTRLLLPGLSLFGRSLRETRLSPTQESRTGPTLTRVCIWAHRHHPLVSVVISSSSVADRQTDSQPRYVNIPAQVGSQLTASYQAAHQYNSQPPSSVTSDHSSWPQSPCCLSCSPWCWGAW